SRYSPFLRRGARTRRHRATSADTSRAPRALPVRSSVLPAGVRRSTLGGEAIATFSLRRGPRRLFETQPRFDAATAKLRDFQRKPRPRADRRRQRTQFGRDGREAPTLPQDGAHRMPVVNNARGVHGRLPRLLGSFLPRGYASDPHASDRGSSRAHSPTAFL